MPSINLDETNPSFPSRGYAAAAVLDGKLYVAGGRTGTTEWGKCINKVDCYDAQTQQWTAIPSMPTARASALMGALHGRLYVVGGKVDTGPPFSSVVVECYDPSTQHWTTSPPMIALAELASTGCL